MCIKCTFLHIFISSQELIIKSLVSYAEKRGAQGLVLVHSRKSQRNEYYNSMSRKNQEITKHTFNNKRRDAGHAYRKIPE